MFGFAKKSDKPSSKEAYDRLTLILQKERSSNALPYLEDLKKDILQVLRKYTDNGNINVKSTTDNNLDLLEVEISLPKN